MLHTPTLKNAVDEWLVPAAASVAITALSILHYASDPLIVVVTLGWIGYCYWAKKASASSFRVAFLLAVYTAVCLATGNISVAHTLAVWVFAAILSGAVRLSSL